MRRKKTNIQEKHSMFKILKFFRVAIYMILASIAVINFTYPISHKHQPPIIAIFSQECPKYKSKIDIDICPPGSSYLPHSYVKFIEESGGEVLILPTYTTNEQLKNLIFKRQISGILLPGGGQFKWEYYRLARTAVRLVLDYEIEMPIFGICHGFELMLVEAFEPNGNARETHRARILERIIHTCLLWRKKLHKGSIFGPKAQKLKVAFEILRRRRKIFCRVLRRRRKNRQLSYLLTVE